MSGKRYWHLFLSENEPLGAIVTSIYGDSNQLPLDAKATGLTFTPPQYHVISFDHEPDEDERDAAILGCLLDQLRFKALRDGRKAAPQQEER